MSKNMCYEPPKTEPKATPKATPKVTPTVEPKFRVGDLVRILGDDVNGQSNLKGQTKAIDIYDVGTNSPIGIKGDTSGYEGCYWYRESQVELVTGVRGGAGGPAPSQPLTLKVGQKYNTKNGSVVEIIDRHSSYLTAKVISGGHSGISDGREPGATFTLDNNGEYSGRREPGMDLVSLHAEPTPVAKLTLEVGKTYRLGDGRMVKLDHVDDDGDFVASSGQGDLSERNWKPNGKKWAGIWAYGPEWDIVAEVKTEAKPATVAPDDSVTLVLTKEEARTLRKITGGVTGNPKNSRRAHTDAVFVKLGWAGISYEGVKAHIDIHFKDEPELFKPVDPPKPKLTMNPGYVYKTRRGGQVQSLRAQSLGVRAHRVRRLDDPTVEYNVHPTGEAHDDKSTCPDDVVELISAV